MQHKDVLDAFKDHGRFPQLVKPPVAVQHNALIESCYHMSVTEKRILMYGISTLRFDDYPPFGDDLKFTIRATEFARLFNIDHNDLYRDLKTGATELLQRIVHMPSIHKSGEYFTWLTHCKYWDNEGTITATFNKVAAEYLCNLKEQFTKIDLLRIADLRSFHAIRLYELLRQWNSTKYRTFNVEEFRMIMRCSDQYPKFSAFRKRVIDPAIEELKKHTDIHPTLNVIYEGKKATRLEFIWIQPNGSAKP